jgi:hypothetical protein
LSDIKYWIDLVGARGFEPPTTCTPCKYATRLRYAPKARIIAEGAQLMTKHSHEKSIKALVLY